MKKSLIALSLAGTMLLSACGDSEKSNDARYDEAYKSNSSYSYEAGEEAVADNAANENAEATPLSYKQSEAKAINTQMLVYSCDMSIDVLDFDKAVDQIQDLIKNYNGFIESENYSDGGNTNQWIYSENQKWKTMNATIRVPSAKYDDFCSEIEEIGDMRRKTSSVQNLTTEYSDLSTTLSIYEAKEKRYLDILQGIENEADAIQVENELTNIQIEIAKIKTRMNNIENDVAYSYIHLNLSEVREYTEKPVVEKTDTFGQRLKNTLSKTWGGFLTFLEAVLFILIRVLPYLIFFALIIFLFIEFIKLICKIADKRSKKKYQQRIQQSPQAPQNTSPASTAPSPEKTAAPPANNTKNDKTK